VINKEDTLREVLRDAIADLNRGKRTYKEQLKKSMVHMYNVPPGDTVDIINGKLPVEGMSLDTMYKLTRVLYEINKNREDGFDTNLLDVNVYFNENQQKYFDQKFIDEEPVGDIIFDKYLQLNPDQFIVVASVDEIIKWRNSRRIRYNEKIQRRMTLRTTLRGNEVRKVTLNPKARQQIRKLMKENKFISNTLTLNINPEYYDPPYITKDDKLVIPSESEIDISDGFHRYLEMTSLKDEDPEFKFNCGFYITVFDEEKANRFIWQEDHKTHLVLEQKETMVKNDEINYLVNRLNTSSNFHHQGKLSDKELFIIRQAIVFTFNKENKLDRATSVKLFKTIEENINSLIEEKNLYDEKFNQKEWFIYIITLYYSIKNKLDFINMVNKLDIDKISSNLSFKVNPKPRHVTIVMNELKEVNENE